VQLFLKVYFYLVTVFQKKIKDDVYLYVYIFIYLFTLKASSQFYFIGYDDTQFSKRLWDAAKQRKIKNSMAMSSVYLYRGKTNSPIEVHYKHGIYLNFDCIKATDMPTTDPRRFSFFTPDHQIDSIQPVSMPIPAMPSYADVQVRFIFFFFYSQYSYMFYLCNTFGSALARDIQQL
jgi:hypothetical protein